MSGRIVLFRAQRVQSSDDAGISIIKTTHAPAYIPGPYTQSPPLPKLPYVPSLSYLCLSLLYTYPDQIHHIGPVRLNYRAPSSPHTFDLLRALIPSYGDGNPRSDELSFNPTLLDPRLWATLVQIYDDLPTILHSYPIPLCDEHLPTLQRIPQTPHFSLITILELPGCPDLTDATISELKILHTLSALDLSGTQISPYGMMSLAGSLLWTDPSVPGERPTRRGPWGLRILRLKDCTRITNKVYPYLLSFPLLSAIGTSPLLI